ncbi:hypothetical protein R3W88_026541 [Solanum pinnatisectum]|uniref:Uncharacterized protein n=1 Tax=Solanum pinnatisectum TaxID=50273 RepID=A0AAV9LHC0_9SOLN|nr:hypothetical protein R3W88_026541 [Solanum pinnatisectum]
MCVGCGRISHTLRRCKEIDKEFIDPLHPPTPKEVERTDNWEIVSFPKRKTLIARKQSTNTPREQERQYYKKENYHLANNYTTLNDKGNIGTNDLITNHPLPSPRLRRSKTVPQADMKKQLGTGGHFDKKWRTKCGDMHLGESVLQGVRGTNQHVSNSLLPTGHNKVHFELEEREGLSFSSSGTESHWTTQTSISTGEGEGLAGTSNTTQPNDELHHMEREGSE